MSASGSSPFRASLADHGHNVGHGSAPDDRVIDQKHILPLCVWGGRECMIVVYCLFGWCPDNSLARAYCLDAPPK